MSNQESYTANDYVTDIMTIIEDEPYNQDCYKRLHQWIGGPKISGMVITGYLLGWPPIDTWGLLMCHYDEIIRAFETGQLPPEGGPLVLDCYNAFNCEPIVAKRVLH